MIRAGMTSTDDRSRAQLRPEASVIRLFRLTDLEDLMKSSEHWMYRCGRLSTRNDGSLPWPTSIEARTSSSNSALSGWHERVQAGVTRIDVVAAEQ